ncbi:MAG: hypothetical protein SCH39_11050 [Methanosarcinales archaeon]|nr:hypothetical protein [Methanosarcinales archaeon]
MSIYQIKVHEQCPTVTGHVELQQHRQTGGLGRQPASIEDMSYY